MSQSSQTDRCALRSLAVGEQLAGSAPQVSAGYLLIEDAGPWGRSGIGESSLRDLARPLEAHAKPAGVKIILIRTPGRASEPPAGRRVYGISHGHHRRAAVSTIGSDDELLDLDLAAIETNPIAFAPAAREVAESLLLICAHAKRDQCCAVEGGPLARSLVGDFPGRVFECTHLGGHRFAPTALHLPSGAVYGRLTRSGAEDLLRGPSHRVLPDMLRGLSHLPKTAQVADAYLRERLGLAEVDDLTLIDSSGGRIVMDAAGDRWQVELACTPVMPRPASCGREPELGEVWSVADARPQPARHSG